MFHYFNNISPKGMTQSTQVGQHTAISIRLSPEQSGKVEYERERLLGIANKSQ